VCWLIGRVIQKEYPAISSDSIVSLFVSELRNEDGFSALISVTSVHVITMGGTGWTQRSMENDCILTKGS
jgi:hypothetical protein